MALHARDVQGRGSIAVDTQTDGVQFGVRTVAARLVRLGVRNWKSTAKSEVGAVRDAGVRTPGLPSSPRTFMYTASF